MKQILKESSKREKALEKERLRLEKEAAKAAKAREKEEKAAAKLAQKEAERLAKLEAKAAKKALKASKSCSSAALGCSAPNCSRRADPDRTRNFAARVERLGGTYSVSQDQVFFPDSAFEDGRVPIGNLISPLFVNIFWQVSLRIRHHTCCLLPPAPVHLQEVRLIRLFSFPLVLQLGTIC